MSAPSAISAGSLTGNLNAGLPSTTPKPGNAPLGQTDFLKLLMSQMQNQDPLNPVSSTDFTSQLAQFSSLQGIQQLNSNFTNMMLLQGLTQGTNLIGKNVTYTKAGATLPSQGVVSSVGFSNGNVQLMVGGNAVGLSQVQSVTAGKAGS